MHRLAVLFACGALWGAAPFEWRDHKDGRMELLEGGQTVLVYNYGPQLKAGAPEDRKRCCYIFPLLTPGGVSPLDDFPKDHYHHRGLFWAWPVVETAQGKYDLWMMRGVEHRLAGPVQTTSAGIATLTADNAWYAGGQAIAGESVRISVRPARGGVRELDVELTMRARGGPVTLRGSQERGKSYGGFSARFAPRERTVIRTESGVLAKDEDLNPHQWAELEAIYGGKKARVRITPDPKNEGAPYQWCLRNYGFAGASFPGRSDKVEQYTLEPGKPVTLRFHVVIADVE